ncbi:serine/threonine-protein kinase [Pyxidicoccus trucidator]|uniref:serine/threonine-protein kinase n=1 Tax=Pyxidicoccus trucidator TaxID=2709662 RepID=UPI0013DC1F47|nr:serine/threonine-protein kinase [Pyxidicoccus trucidator]
MSSESAEQVRAAEQQREQELFLECLELAPEARTARLEVLVAEGDAVLVERLRRLLALHAQVASRSLSSRGDTPDGVPLERIGGYKVVQRLGEGGMGEVFLAAQSEPVRRLVAVKVVKPGMDSREVLARFDAERQALALMSHPHIARILDAGATEAGRPYFVMEYVPGVPLTRYCDEAGLGVEARLRLMQDVCAAVQHAHHKGVIHRDLKPSNILVTEVDGQPHPKVIDFGIAKATSAPLTDSSLHTRVGHMMGTPDYMSPEQAAGTPLDVDTRTDVYSLGAILHELLTGATPHGFGRRGDALSEVQARLREVDPPRPSARVRSSEEGTAHARRCGLDSQGALARRLSGDVDWVVLRALARDRGRRYPTAAALAEDLSRHLRDEPVAAHAPSLTYSLGKFLRRHRAFSGAVALVVAVLSLSSVLLARQAREVARERDRANAEAATANRVTDLLAEVFRAADPGARGSGADLTARQLLDRGTKRVLADLPTPSPARARLLQTLGRAHLNLGLYAEAMPLVERALSDSRQVRGEEAEGTFVLRREVALLQRRLGRLKESEATFQETLAAARKALGPRHPEVWMATSGLATVYLSQERLPEATPLLEAAFEGLRAGPGLEDARTLAVGSDLAASRGQSGRHAEAAELFTTVLHGRERLLGERHPDTLATASNLAVALKSLGRYDESIALNQRVLAARREVQGPEHPEALQSQQNLALLYRRKGEHAKAEPLMREAHAGLERVLGPNHMQTLHATYNLGLVLSETPGTYAEGEALFLRAMQGYDAAVGPRNLLVPRVRVALANLHAKRGDLAAATRELKLALDAGLSRKVALEDPTMTSLQTVPELATLLAHH